MNVACKSAKFYQLLQISPKSAKVGDLGLSFFPEPYCSLLEHLLKSQDQICLITYVVLSEQ